MNKRYKPLVDKLYWMLFVPTVVLVALICVISSFSAPLTLFLTLPIFLFVLYFFISPLFGYVEFRESTLYIKYGFFLRKEIPYNTIRGAVKERKFYAESMLSLKNAFEHVNIKYNSFDVTTVSVKTNDSLIEALERRVSNK